MKKYEHDCENCLYVQTVEIHDEHSSGELVVFDLYIHPRKGHIELICRDGNEPSEYASGGIFYHDDIKWDEDLFEKGIHDRIHWYFARQFRRIFSEYIWNNRETIFEGKIPFGDERVFKMALNASALITSPNMPVDYFEL